MSISSGVRPSVCLFATTVLGLALFTADVVAQVGGIHQAILAETNQKTPDISTEHIRRILADRSAIVVDTRPRAEFVAGHIPGARGFVGQPSGYVAEVEQLVGGDKTKALVLYCNGPFCQASKRLSEQLLDAGFTNIQRYQLGMPIWRALGGPTEIELEGIVRNFHLDKTVVYFDARSPQEFAKGSLPGALNNPVETFDTAGMPWDDFNRRIVLFGRDAAQARALADVLSKRAWHNVSYFPGSFESLAAALKNM
jgi:rhodanese-related sulfurtransferase